ncbi:hypothetical protein CKO15_06110 [Halorhodospira abdelmalekii]|uniref:MobH family relaxase n=1 Tax=Halorhodospira abdelmalekii TaxID=421629 RepID=UPI0019035417|nr:MobH family relaxase [Halorhodospira abdelmalekii]MBK1734870.1 hypothetical protein [Halorhodospira abdelmalekii]
MLNGLITFGSRRQSLSREKPPRAGLIAVCSSEKLLNTPVRRQRLRKIAQLLAFPEAHRRKLVDRAVQHFAALVQGLPASEAHHHAGLGGLLDHGLETALYSLQRRQGHILPPHAEPEQIVHEADVWSYAVLVLALTHDLGKIVVDQHITLYDANGQRLGHWDPWQGSMLERGATWYAVRYIPERAHRLHEPVSALLAHRVIPPAGLSWIARHRELLTLWSAALHGRLEDAGIIGQLLHQADRESVAQNLGGDRPAPVGAVKQPLGERLLTTLRYLVREGSLPLNRNGAAGWLQGEDLWLVSKRISDALREQLHEEGFHSIPSRNERLFDVFQEYGLIVPNGDRAIWRAHVTGDGWQHELTLLRMQASRIWPDAEQRPADFDGQIEPLTSEATATVEADPPPETRSDADPVEEAAPESAPKQAEEEQADAKPHAEHPVAAMPPLSGDAGEAFWAWLTTSIEQDQISMNTTDARVHIIETEEGELAVLLVSPGIFQDFGREHSIEWQHVQKRFLKKRLHVKTARGTNIHRYIAQGERRQSELKGVVIPAHTVTEHPPSPNRCVRPVA